jgi:tetratricopeptide (TPR) repeat protein
VANTSVKLFPSCVSDEFGVYRDALRQALTRPNVEVKIQEDFKALGGDTLSMLEAYVEQCEAVVHFAGDMTGAAPAPSSVEDVLVRRPDLEAKLAKKGVAREALAALTYTQWEAWLAICFGKDLLIVQPGAGVDRGPKFVPTDASRASQTEHLKRLKAINRYPGPAFTSADNLIAQIVTSAVIDALVKAAATPTRRPRNLPFASLGSLFKGRDTALDDLRVSLASSQGAAVVGRALHGLGGIGKTRLAIEYALRYEADYSAVLFARAADPATLNASLAALVGADILDLPEKAAQKDAVKIAAALNWLAFHPTWLMILDNIDDEQAVAAAAELMARLKGGHVIVTARASEFPASIKTLELGVLAPEPATVFLMERTQDKRAVASDDKAEARALAEELGGLALGLEQAGVYIARQRIGFARYLALWREKRESVLKWFDRTATSYDHEVGLAMTWAASVEKLNPDSRRLLDRLAFLAPDPIPDALIDVAAPGEAADVDPLEAQAGLYAYSLITRGSGEDGATNGFVMHRLVQDFARRAMTEERRGEALREALTWVDAAFVGAPDDVRNWPLFDRLAPHALVVAQRADKAAIADPTARVFNALGVLSRAKARFAEAESLHRRALAIDEASRGPDHPDVARDLFGLAELLYDTDRIGETEPLVRRALAIDEASCGPDHPNVGRDLNALAALLREANRFDVAEPPVRRALAIAEKSLAPNDPGVANCLNNLAKLLEATNRRDEAERFFRRAQAIYEASYGPDHPTVASNLIGLAGLLYDTNRLREAEPLVRRALAIGEASLRPDHPNLGIILNTLALVLQLTNRLDEAEPLFRRTLAIYEKSLGADHPYSVSVRKSLAALKAARDQG